MPANSAVVMDASITTTPHCHAYTGLHQHQMAKPMRLRQGFYHRKRAMLRRVMTGRYFDRVIKHVHMAVPA